MPTVIVGEDTVNIKGDLPKENDRAPDFTFVKQDLSEANFYDFGDMVKVILAVPSLDTGVCATETKRFNQEAANLGSEVAIITISMDLPFAQKRALACRGNASRSAPLSRWRG